MKFKIGDKVKIIEEEPRVPGDYRGHTGIVLGTEYNPENKIKLDNGEVWYFENRRLKLLTKKDMKPKKVNFILKYELDEDPIEEFATMAQVEKRIKELIKVEDSLQRDSMVVYEVKSVKKVEIETKITIK